MRSIAVRAGAAIALTGLAVLAGGCSSAAPPAASSSPSPTTTPSATTVSQPTVSPGTATVPASASPSASPAGVPTLGQLAGDFAHGQGFGEVKPAKIFNGGDPTGLVTNVVWTSWGGAQATAAGTAEYVAPNQSVAQGTEETATVVAFDLGTCGGKYMYQAVEWYFPQHSQAFNPNTYENICTGSYAGTPQIIISRAGRPVAKVIPLAGSVQRSGRGSLRGRLVLAPGWDSPEVNEYIAAEFG